MFAELNPRRQCAPMSKKPPKKSRPRPSAISAMPPPGRAVALWLRRGRVVLGRAGPRGLPGTLRAAAATRGAAEVSAACGPGGGSPPRADPAPPGPPAQGLGRAGRARLFPRRGRARQRGARPARVHASAGPGDAFLAPLPTCPGILGTSLRRLGAWFLIC